MHIITSLPIDSSLTDTDILTHIRKRLTQTEIIDIPNFSFMMFDSLLSIGDKLEKLETQIEKTYYLFIEMMAKQKKDSNGSNGYGKTYEECENDVVNKLKTFKWVYESGSIESVYTMLEMKVSKEDEVLDERVKGIKELIDEQRRMKNEKYRKSKVALKSKIQEKTESGKERTQVEHLEGNKDADEKVKTSDMQNNKNDGENSRNNNQRNLTNTLQASNDANEKVKTNEMQNKQENIERDGQISQEINKREEISRLQANNDLKKEISNTENDRKQEHRSEIGNESSKTSVQSYLSFDNSHTQKSDYPIGQQGTIKSSKSTLSEISLTEIEQKHKTILENSLKEMNVKNIPENTRIEINQNKFICNDGESLRDLEIYTENHEMIRQHYFIANDKQNIEQILKSIPELCVETLQLHLKTKHERLYSVFALEGQSEVVVDKLSEHFEYKDTITKEEYDNKIDRITKNDNLLTITKNNLDLYLSTNYFEVLNVFLHVKLFRVYIESILHYGIGDIKIFVIENKISEWRKIIREWRFSRRLCKDLKLGDLFPHSFVGRNEEKPIY